MSCSFMSLRTARVMLLFLTALPRLAITGDTTLWARQRSLADAPGIESVTLPDGYRNWRMISVAHEGGNLNDIRAILGNDVAFEAFRDGRTTIPNGAIIVRLAWTYRASAENNKAFGTTQSFVAGAPTNVQVLSKNSRRFAATGGWGFGQFSGGRHVNEASAKECFACHLYAAKTDFVFTRYAP